MGLSETIIAAIIGAGATMATAIFQLIRNRSPIDVRPKRNRIRSLLATIALMIGCIVGGYAWSSLRAVSATEQMRSTLQSEFARQFAALATNKSDADHPPAGIDTGDKIPPASPASSASAQSLVRLPPCAPAEHSDDAGFTDCAEHSAPIVALCAALPAEAQDTRLLVMVRTLRPDSTWQRVEAGAATTGALRVSEARSEQSSTTERWDCLNVSNRSIADTLVVRLQTDYTLPPPATESAAAPMTASLQ